MTHKTLIALMFCIVLSGCGGSDEPQPLSKDAWKKVDCPPQRPGQYCLLEGHADEVRAIAFDESGKTLVSVSYYGTAKIWDVLKGEVIYSFVVPNKSPCSYENFSRLCTRVFFQGGRVIHTVISPLAVEYIEERPTYKAENPWESVTITQFVQFPIYIWDVEQKKIVETIKDCHTRSHLFTVSADGKYIASECFNRELNKPDEYFSYSKERYGPVRNICFMPNAKSTSPESNKFLVVWDAQTGKPIRRLGAGLCGRDEHDILALSFRGTEVLAGMAGGDVWIWDIALQKDEDPPLRKVKALGDGIEVIARWVIFSPDGKRVVMHRGREGIVIAYDVDSGKEVSRIAVKDSILGAFSRDSRFLAGGDGALRVWDVASGKLLWESPDLGVEGDAVAFSTKDKFVAVSAGQYIVLLRFR